MRLSASLDVALRFAGHAFPNAAASAATVLRNARSLLREMEDAVLCERSVLDAVWSGPRDVRSADREGSDTCSCSLACELLQMRRRRKAA